MHRHKRINGHRLPPHTHTCTIHRIGLRLLTMLFLHENTIPQHWRWFNENRRSFQAIRQSQQQQQRHVDHHRLHLKFNVSSLVGHCCWAFIHEPAVFLSETISSVFHCKRRWCMWNCEMKTRKYKNTTRHIFVFSAIEMRTMMAVCGGVQFCFMHQYTRTLLTMCSFFAFGRSQRNRRPWRCARDE